MRERVAETERLLAEANGAVSRMQRRNHPRGADRQQLRAQQHHAREAHANAVEYLENDLPAQARAAGAQTSWLRSFRAGTGGHSRPPTGTSALAPLRSASVGTNIRSPYRRALLERIHSAG